MRVDRSRLPDLGPDPAFGFPRIARQTLRNGLQVRTVEHHTVPVVTMVVQVDGGAVADPPGQEGLAAITADMVDEGTGSLSAIEVSEGLARIGAVYDVDVGADATRFSLTTLSRFADRGAALLADILVRPSLRASDFDRVRQMRLDRLRQLQDIPSAVAERAFLRLMYGEHPYGHLPIGNALALDALALEDVAAFHATRFRPSRATITVAGPLSHEGLLRLVDNAFSGWSEASAQVDVQAPGDPTGQRWMGGPPEGRTAPEAALPARLAVVRRDGVPQSELRIGHLSARRDTPDYPALLVMNAVLGGQFVSRINLKLREEKGYTYGARSGFDWRRGIAPFSVQASVHTASTADAISDCLAELEGIRGPRPPSEHEMSLAKASLTLGYPRSFETAQQVARSVARLALFGLPETYFEEFIPRVHAVEAADVIRVAERYVDPARAVTLVVGDYQAVAESLRPLGLGEPQLLPADV
ncbi:insulinase family protein [bacterium AH-315-O15]|nr:insulinase family protein [bacterium AH-315-O15]